MMKIQRERGIAEFAASTTVICVIAAAMPACQHAGTKTIARTVSLTEFAQPRGSQESEAVEVALTVSEQEDTDVPVDPGDDEAIESGSVVRENLTATPGISDRWPQMLSQPGDQMIIEGKIGEVNGRPIFAEELLGKAESQIMAIWSNPILTPQQRVSDIRETLRSQLEELVNSELVLADAESQLTEQEQVGLFAFLRESKEEQIALSSGSRVDAEQRLLKEEGMTLEQYMEERRQVTLVDIIKFRKIFPRVIVSWRDVEREYKHREGEFRKPASIVLARISLRTDRNSDLIQTVDSELARGTPFAEVATIANVPNDGWWGKFDIGSDGTFEELDSRVADAIAQLNVGETSPAIQLENTTWWVHVLSFEPEILRDVYEADVQRTLKDSIRARLFYAELDRYLRSLRDRWVADDIQKMHTRLFDIARKRYLR